MMPYRAVVVSRNTFGVWIEAGARLRLPLIVFAIPHRLVTTKSK